MNRTPSSSSRPRTLPLRSILSVVAVVLGIAAAPAQAGSGVPPANDDCSNAIVLVDGVTGGTLVGATPSPSAVSLPLSCGDESSAPDVWYVITAPGPGFLTVSTCGTHDANEPDEGIDTLISIHESCGGASIGCNDNGFCAGDLGEAADSLVEIIMADSQEYWIRVSSIDGSVGDFTLEVSTLIAPTCPEPILESCSADCSTGDLTVIWDEVGFNDGYSVAVSTEAGVLVETASGQAGFGTTTEVFTGLPAGRYTVEITNFCLDGTATFPVTCSVDVGQYTDQSNLVYRPDRASSVESAAALLAALDANGQSSFVVNRLDSPCIDALISASDPVIWIMLGADPFGSGLSLSDGQKLVELLTSGVAVYIESPDMWGFDGPQPFLDYDGVAGGAADFASLPNGDDGFTAMTGTTHDLLALSDLGSVGYTPNPMIPGVTTDQLTPTDSAAPSGIDVGSVSAGLVWTSSSEGYGVAVFNRTQPDFGNVLCQSWEIRGFSGDSAVLVERYRRALLGLGPNFRRGDCNGDENFDIADAITALSFLFSGGSVSCDDACDSNDDGTLDIADAITKLGMLFAGGAPFGPCAQDGTPGDALSCDASPCP
ncbi:MAG: hypothetical protein AAF488_06995 [Planctomycetota bacterium]